MKVIENISQLDKTKGCVLALGNFDGVHTGHLHLLDRARSYANENGFAFGVYTFTDSPKYRNPEHSLLTALDSRISAIVHKTQSPPDFLFLESFEKVKNLSPFEFVDYIIREFRCECTFCGENFRFGAGACGDSRELVSLMREKGRDAVIVESVYDENEIVSSTLIKSLIESGNCRRAARLLAFPYGFSSRIIHGAHLGHRLGFPTVNQIIPEELVCPKYGVYSSIVVVDGKEYFGVTNFGVKPTVSSGGSPVAETHIIGFDGDIYGKDCTLLFCNYLREEKKFSSLEELRENISFDVARTRAFFEETYEA